MKIQQKPDYLIFAEGSKSGELSEFPDIERGWGVTLEQTQGKPPLEWMNSAFNRVDANMLYLLQQGIPEWDGSVLYPIGTIIKVEGTLYEAKTQNTDLNPTNSPNDWQLVVRFQDATTTQKGIVQLSSNTNSNSEAQAATSKAVKTAYDLAKNALPKTGGTLTGALTGTDITAKTSLTVGSAKATSSDTGINFDKPLLINNTEVLKKGDYGLFTPSQTLTKITNASQLGAMRNGERLFVKGADTTVLPTSNHGYLIKNGVRDNSGGGYFLFSEYTARGRIWKGTQLGGRDIPTWHMFITTENISRLSIWIRHKSNLAGCDFIKS